MDQPKWKILFYETKRGESQVYEFFKKQQPRARSKITHRIASSKTICATNFQTSYYIYVQHNSSLAFE